MAGLERARREGSKLGRKRLEDTAPEKIAAVRKMRAKGMGVRRGVGSPRRWALALALSFGCPAQHDGSATSVRSLLDREAQAA
jgi:DNA invertase Pin-like site-specific DNA recombinase